MKRFLWGLVASAILVGESGQAKAQSNYLYTTLQVPGSPRTSAYGINNYGQIVGNDNGLGFLFSGGSYTRGTPKLANRTAILTIRLSSVKRNSTRCCGESRDGHNI